MFYQRILVQPRSNERASDTRTLKLITPGPVSTDVPSDRPAADRPAADARFLYDVLIGASALPTFTYVYLRVLGREGWEALLAVEFFLFVGSLGVLGAVLVAALRSGLVASVAVTLVALLIIPHLGVISFVPRFLSLPQFALAAQFLVAGGIVLVGSEFVVRRGHLLDRVAPPRVRLLGALGGGLHLAALLSLGFGLGVWDWTAPIEILFDVHPFEQLLISLTLVGVFLSGAVPGALFARWRLLSPAAAVATLFAWTTVSTWQYVSVVGWTPGLAPVERYAFFWTATFGAVLLLAAAEYLVRGWYE